MLYDSIKEVDPGAEILVADDVCEWVRSSLSIVGLIRIESKLEADELRNVISDRIKAAYSLVDDLSDEKLALEDLWNLLLLIQVPWTRDEVRLLPATAQVLSNVANDTKGSRKIIVWTDSTPAQYVGPLGEGMTSWIPPSGDPLHDTVKEFARDSAEAIALEVLFKRRISDDEIEELIQTLTRGQRT